MAYRTKNQNTYVHGDNNCVCEICGFKFKASDLTERWDGKIVCADDWEPRHPLDGYRYKQKKKTTPAFTIKDDSSTNDIDVWEWGDGVVIAWADDLEVGY